MSATPAGGPEVLVVGAGPVGLTLACELARHAVPHRVVDKRPGVEEISKALILHVRTQEVFGLMGLADRARAEARPLLRVELHAYGKHVGRWDLDGVDSPYRHPVILGQNRTSHLLEEHLLRLGGRAEWGVEATSLRVDGGGAALTLRHADGRAEEVRGRYVVGCEGSKSIVRETLGIPFEGERYEGEQFIQADCRIRWALPAGAGYLFLTREGYMMVIEMPGGLVRVFVSLPDDDPSNTKPPALGDVRDALVRLGGFAAELSDPVWLARYRTSHRKVARFRDGPAFLAGDAAHVHVPIGGQGMNTGIQDAFNLGWKLAAVLRGRARPGLLDTYGPEREPVAAALLAGTDRAYRFVLHPGEALQRAARLFGPSLVGLGAVQSRFRNTLEEIGIGYPHGPLTEDHGGTRGPAAGARAPDAVAVRRVGLQTVTLYDLYRGTRWTLLLLAGTDPDAETSGRLAMLAGKVEGRFGDAVAAHVAVAAAEWPGGEYAGSVLLDAEHYLHDRYGAGSPAAYLIRPDGYVGFRGRLPAAEGKLVAYLERHFVRDAS